jgi:acyl carrier protein
VSPSPEAVRAFVVDELRDALDVAGMDADALGEDFDLVGSGLLDSLGMLELIMALDERFSVEVDYEGLDPERLTVLGALASHVARAEAGLRDTRR